MNDEEIITMIKKEHKNLSKLKCTVIRDLKKNTYAVVVMKLHHEGEGLGSSFSIPLYDINFKEKSSAERLEMKLKKLFKQKTFIPS